MANFSHLSSLRVTDNATAEFTFFLISGEPTITVRPAGQTNRDFFNAALALSKIATRRNKGKRQASPTLKSLEAARQEDIRLFTEYIVTGWSGVLDSEGNEVPFDSEVCAEFLDAIPPDMFIELKQFCLDIENFRDLDQPMDVEDLDDVLGN